MAEGKKGKKTLANATDREMTAFKNGLAQVVNRFTTKNDFMG
jgi:hypothetical protein